MPDTLAKVDKPVARCLIVDANGTVGQGESRALEAPAIRVKVVKAIGGDDGSSKGFEPLVEYMGPGDTEPTAVAEVYGRTGFFAKEADAWDAAREHAATTVYAAYEEALNGDDRARVAKLRKFLGVLRDRCIVERAKIKGQKSVEYSELQGDDLATALRVASEFFREIDAQVIIGFRQRISSDGHEWTKGKTPDGSSALLPGKAEKLGSEKPGLLRSVFGYAPQVMVTVCAAQWRGLDQRRKEAVLHDLLSRIGYDPEKKSIFIHEPVGMFPATAREYADTKPVGILDVCQSLLEGMVNHGVQGEMIGFRIDDAESKSDMPTLHRVSVEERIAARAEHGLDGDAEDHDDDSSSGRSIDDCEMTMTFDGKTSAPFTGKDLKRATKKLQGRNGSRRKAA